MKKMIFVLTILFSGAAFADHNLGSVISENAGIAAAVAGVETANGVVCDVQSSYQEYYYKSEKGGLGTAWTQTASCYNQVLNGVFYGLVGQIKVSYTWEDYAAGTLLSISYEAY